MTEREWQRLEDTMRFIVEQQAKFEANFAAADERFEKAERRMDRMERYADRVIKAGERRLDRAEAETADLRRTFKSFLEAMRRSAGNGKGKR